MVDVCVYECGVFDVVVESFCISCDDACGLVVWVLVELF